MNCRKIIIALSEYLEGALDPLLKKSIEIHLAKCEDCRLVVDTPRHTIEIYCKSEPAPLPATTRQKLHEALRKRLQA